MCRVKKKKKNTLPEKIGTLRIVSYVFHHPSRVGDVLTRIGRTSGDSR